jgi:hypothetical protein
VLKATNLGKVDQAPGTKRVVGGTVVASVKVATSAKLVWRITAFETALIILAAKRSQYFLNPALVLQLFVLCALPTQRTCCELAKVA